MHSSALWKDRHKAVFLFWATAALAPGRQTSFRKKWTSKKMSTCDPKRTWPAPNPTPSRALAQIATLTSLSLGGDYEATRLHQTSQLSGCVAADSARAACRNAACGRLARGSRK